MFAAAAVSKCTRREPVRGHSRVSIFSPSHQPPSPCGLRARQAPALSPLMGEGVRWVARDQHQFCPVLSGLCVVLENERNIIEQKSHNYEQIQENAARQPRLV